MIRLPGDRRSLLDRAGTLLGLILVAAIFGMLVGGQFFAPANVELMARQTAIVCTAALGMTIVIALGGIDLSVGSMISLGTVVIALLLQQGVSPIGAALGGIFAVGDPTVAVGLELDVIAAVIIGGGSLLGGRGSVAGTVMGAGIMAIIQVGCTQKGLASWVQQILTGAIIVAAVALDRVRTER